MYVSYALRCRHSMFIFTTKPLTFDKYGVETFLKNISIHTKLFPDELCMPCIKLIAKLTFCVLIVDVVKT